MPEIHFRLVAVSNDGRELTWPNSPCHSLGEYRGAMILRFKKDCLASHEERIALVNEMGLSGAKPVFILPWYVDLIKLVPVR